MLPGGKPPEAGDTMRNPALAATLRRIGREGRAAFYEGAVARDIVNRLKELGGLHEEADFAAQRSSWVEPIHAPYRGYDVYEMPPANQGLTALMILRTLEGYALDGDGFSEADRLHLIAEATKAAYQVRDSFIGDPDFAPVDVAGFLSDAWAERTRRAIRLDRALPPPAIGKTAATRTRSTCASSTATATRCRSSTRCSRRSAPASWRPIAASSCTTAAAGSARSPATPTRSPRRSARSIR